MSKLYYVRHGQTELNAVNRVCGAIDSPLTAQGRAQAEETARKLQASGIHIDMIIHSPLSRAYETALPIARALNVPMVAEPRLVEVDFGRFEGALRTDEGYQAAKLNFCARFGGNGDSLFRVAQRVYNVLDELKAQPDKTFLIVGHGSVSRVVRTYFQDNITNDEFYHFGVKNAEVAEFEFPS